MLEAVCVTDPVLDAVEVTLDVCVRELVAVLVPVLETLEEAVTVLVRDCTQEENVVDCKTVTARSSYVS